MSDSENSQAECETAMNAAITRALDFCGNDQKQADALGRLLGVDGVDETKHLESPPSDPMEQRQWVASRALSKVQGDGGDPYNAIEEAWADLSDEQPDPEPDRDEPESVPESDPEPEPEPEATESDDPESDEDTGQEDEGQMLNADDILEDA